MISKIQNLLGNLSKKKKLILSAVGVCLLGASTTYGMYEGTKESVTVQVDGKKETIRTHADTVEELFEDLDIEIKEQDYVSPSKDAKILENMSIIYKEAKPVNLVVNDERRTIWTTAQTVEELLNEENISFKEHDKVEPALETQIQDDMTLNVKHAIQLSVNVGGDTQQVWSTSTTVADFLEEHEIQLNELDKVEPELSAKLQDINEVIVTRVEKVTDVVEESVAYNVVERKDQNLERGKEKVVQPGKKGTVENHYEIILENGKEVARELIKSVTKTESVDKIVAVGTKAPPQTTTVSRSTSTSSSEFYVVATAYTASCSGCSGVTATGYNLKANPQAKVIAVDPSVIPLGSKVYVEGYGYAVAADTGSAIKGNKIDVFFADKSTAYRWGRKTVKIRVLN
ncbi:ubiquitin-like domain-containing protein [Bacillus kexueae]|uniref:ubiquitin-like domain-containing protein n=1 Tax=Aeribacillus kexueae TaxID=2078952 RepID=UPI00311A9C28